MSKQRQILKDNNTEYLVTVNTASNEVKHVRYKYMDVVSVIKMVRRFSKEKQKYLLFAYHRVVLCINMLSKVKGCSITGNINGNTNREKYKTRN